VRTLLRPRTSKPTYRPIRLLRGVFIPVSTCYGQILHLFRRGEEKPLTVAITPVLVVERESEQAKKRNFTLFFPR
jgi:hypothetical protein